MTFTIVKKLGLADGIEAVRRLLPRCWFNEERCRTGLHALRNYRKSWNRAMNEFTGTPVHNWASHPADGFRTLALGLRYPDGDESDTNDDEKDPFAERGGGDYGWMG
jgi:hypothetical protein